MQISLVTLLDFAIQNSNVQLILLSPQDVAAVEDARMAVQQNIKKGIASPKHFMKIVRMQHTRHGANR